MDPSCNLRLVAAALVSFIALAGCVRSESILREAGADDIGWKDVIAISASRDYFTLRERLEKNPEETAPALFARGLVQHAFNQPAASKETLAMLRSVAVPDTLRATLQQVQINNHLRLFEYREGLAAIDVLLEDSARLAPPIFRELTNGRRIFHALQDVPPQVVEIRGRTRLRVEQGRVPVYVNDSLRHFAFDTGANLSTIMRSEAEELGVLILPAGLDVGTATDQRVVADLGVADRFSIGGMHYRHVVFLVLDDSLLTFSGGFTIPGLIGFPVIEQMGEIQLATDGELIVPEHVPDRPQQNLALTGLTPLTRVVWENERLLCRLDTGADKTDLYEPFYRRFRGRIDAASQRSTHTAGGVGGRRELPVRILSAVEFELGDAQVRIDSVRVITRSIVAEESANYLDCNLGLDVVGAFSMFILNFREMAFLLR